MSLKKLDMDLLEPDLKRIVLTEFSLMLTQCTYIFYFRQVKNSGYKIKNQFKTLTQPFSVFVAPGESTSVVLKKIPGVKYSWPPAGIEVFR